MMDLHTGKEAPRKIIQVAAMGYQRDVGNVEETIVALCNDGTLWMMDPWDHNYKETNYAAPMWRSLPNVPQD